MSKATKAAMMRDTLHDEWRYATIEMTRLPRTLINHASTDTSTARYDERDEIAHVDGHAWVMRRWSLGGHDASRKYYKWAAPIHSLEYRRMRAHKPQGETWPGTSFLPAVATAYYIRASYYEGIFIMAMGAGAPSRRNTLKLHAWLTICYDRYRPYRL